jgi:hypothetical protein
MDGLQVKQCNDANKGRASFDTFRASSKDSLYLSKMTGIEFLLKKHPPTASSIGYPNIDILYSEFLASQR